MQISAYLGAKRRLQTTSVRQIFAPLGTFIDINANKDPFPLSVFRSISLIPIFPSSYPRLSFSLSHPLLFLPSNKSLSEARNWDL